MGSDSVSSGSFMASSTAIGRLALLPHVRTTAQNQTASADTPGQLPEVAVRNKAGLQGESLYMSQVLMLQDHWQPTEYHPSFPDLRDTEAKG